jgi:hypothetical protein
MALERLGFWGRALRQEEEKTKCWYVGRQAGQIKKAAKLLINAFVWINGLYTAKGTWIRVVEGGCGAESMVEADYWESHRAREFGKATRVWLRAAVACSSSEVGVASSGTGQ